jgi:hypothetical protein
MVGCPWLKAVLVRAANFTLYHLARPTHDASNGFRLFSRRVTIEISIKSVHALGSYAPCTARLSNTIHSFFVETVARSGGWGRKNQGQVRHAA